MLNIGSANVFSKEKLRLQLIPFSMLPFRSSSHSVKCSGSHPVNQFSQPHSQSLTRPLLTFVLTRTSRLKGNDPKLPRCQANVYRVMLKMNTLSLSYSKCNAGLNSSPTLLRSCGARMQMNKEFPQEQFFSTLNCSNAQM